MNQKTVLLVEDNPQDSTAYSRYLSTYEGGYGFGVHMASTGEEALMLYSSLQPDCVLLDYQLPDVDGLTLLLQLRDLAPKESLCAVMMTGVGSENLAVQALREGASDYLVKQGITRETLGKSVARAIEQHELRKRVAWQQQQLIETNRQLQESMTKLRQKEDTLLKQNQELKQLNKSLQQSQAREQAARAEAERQRERLERLFREAPALVNTQLGPDHVFELVHPLTYQLLGNRPLAGKPSREAIPELQGPFEQLLNQVYSTGQPYYGKEVRAELDRNNDGMREEVYFDFTYQPMFDKAGQVEGVMTFAVEVTDQVRARQAIEENAKRQQLILDAMPQLVWLVQPDMSVSYFNRQWYTYTGAPADDQRHSLEYAHPEDRERLYQTGQACFSSGQKWQQEYRLRRADGAYRWFSGQIVPLTNAEGSIFCWVGTATDIHEQKEAQQALEEREKRFRFMTNTVPQIIWTTTAQGEVDYFNERWREYSGLTMEDTIGLGWSALLHPDDIQSTFESWKESLETGKEFKVEQRIRNQQGEYRWLLSRALPLTDTEDRITKWFGTSVDIEDQKRRLEQLSQAKQEIEGKNQQLFRVNVDLDNFVYTASHDLRAPVATLEGLQRLLTKRLQGRLSEDEQQFVGLMSESIVKLNRMIGNLGQIARSQQQEKDQMKEWIYFKEILQEVAQDIRPLLEETQAQIHTQFEVEAIEYPRNYLHSILYNLLSNAVKYRSADRRPVVQVRTRKEERGVCLSVIDNGLGLDPESLPKLFAPFKRLHTHVEGTGIGLYSIKRTIENHGGRITVESQPGTGSTFNVFFPLPITITTASRENTG